MDLYTRLIFESKFYKRKLFLFVGKESGPETSEVCTFQFCLIFYFVKNIHIEGSEINNSFSFRKAKPLSMLECKKIQYRYVIFTFPFHAHST